jgi:hypothetical protein
MRPVPGDYAPFYETYVSLVPEVDLLDAMHGSLEEIRETLESIAQDKADYAYAEGKWTVRELLQHIIDTERVFSYRAICIARGEQQPLPGFDENAYASLADVSHRSLKEMKEELLALRSSVYLMFRGFNNAMLERTGTASGKPITVNALGYICIGHIRHHSRILRERYLL